MVIYYDIELVIHASEEMLCFQAGYAHKSGEFVMHCPLTDKIKLFYHDLFNAGHAAHKPCLGLSTCSSLHLLLAAASSRRVTENDAHG